MLVCTMRGARNGVAKQLSDEESRAVCTHCYGHLLNLAAADSIKNSKIMKDNERCTSCNI